jgi:hypothetical protein
MVAKDAAAMSLAYINIRALLDLSPGFERSTFDKLQVQVLLVLT